MFLSNSVNSAIQHGKKAVSRRVAALWQRGYRVQYWLRERKSRYGSVIFITVLLPFPTVSIFSLPAFQHFLESIYTTEQAVEGLRNLILNTGTALIGSTAIVTSLVLFAMQVNIERMPHGLFRRLSADWSLLSAFALTFLLAIGVATLSTFVNQARLALSLLLSMWAIGFIFILYLYVYRRALILINPLHQLEMLVGDTRKRLRTWVQRAKRATPLLEQEDSTATMASPMDSTHDLARIAFFQVNNHWTNEARRAVQHAMSFARRYAEQGDYEVSGAALLNAVVAINAAYIDAKGKTFYANNPYVDNPLASDGFINDTLEHLRQNVQSGIARGDEQQIELTLQTMARLVRVYLDIDYSTPYASNSHAHLAASYLKNAVEAVVPHDMADVLMEGQRLMGQSAQHLLAYGNPNDIAALSEKIALIACAGSVNKNHHPVVMRGMEQLTDLTFALLCSKNCDIGFAVEKVHQDVSLVVELFLKVPDTPLSSNHSTFLGPYYSSVSMNSLRKRLAELVSITSQADPENADAHGIIQNIEQWADRVCHTEKELLLAAITEKSHFTFDMIHWITGVTEILLAASNVSACGQHIRDKLREHASWLIATLDWIPDDEETVTFVEHFQMTETLFRSAIDAHNRGCDQIARKIGQILLSWTFKAGRYQTGQGVLQKGLCGAAVFAQLGGEEQTVDLMTAIEFHLSAESAPEQEIRDHAAREIQERVATLFRKGHWSSHIEMGIAQASREQLRPLLEKIADLLSRDRDY